MPLTVPPDPALDALEAQVTATEGVMESAIVFIQGVPALIAEAFGADDPRVVALNARITAKTQALAEAIAANSGGS